MQSSVESVIVKQFRRIESAGMDYIESVDPGGLFLLAFLFPRNKFASRFIHPRSNFWGIRSAVHVVPYCTPEFDIENNIDGWERS